MQDRLDALKVAADAISARTYLNYKGRYYFTGHGVVLEDIADLGALTVAMADAGLRDLAAKRPHVDSIGRNVIVAWPLNDFMEKTDAGR